MKSVICKATLIAFCMAGATQAQVIQNVLFSENFDGLTLMPSVNERLGTAFVTRTADDPDSSPVPNVFSSTGPAGWTTSGLTQFDGVPSAGYNPVPTTGNTGVPGAGVFDYGVDEWEGWNFVNKDFWASAAGGQQRENFTSATGTVAVVDPDEYFDLGGPSDATNGGYYNASMSTPTVAVNGGNLYSISFDSSWRPEAFDDDHPTGLLNANNQAVEVLARFSDGSAVVVDGWNSDSASATFKGNAVDEQVTGVVAVPAGATGVSFEFNMANAGNDWWWAVDNIDVSEFGGSSVWSEDFEGVALGDSINERTSFSKVTAAESAPDTQARPDSFTNVPPSGWAVDNSGIPGGGASRDDNGVYEFEGWNFMTRDFWTFADGQGRGDFLKGTGIFAVADSDEFDDLGTGNDDGPLDTLLVTPLVDISTVEPGELALAFDSAWRDESDQTAIVEAEFFDSNGNSLGTVEAIRWESDSSSANFHDDNTNESVLAMIDNPAGAASVQLTFGYLNGSNNWYWAVDNIELGTGVVPEPSSLGLVLVALMGLGAFRRK